MHPSWNVTIKQHDYINSVKIYLHHESDNDKEVFCYPIKGGWETREVKLGGLIHDIPALEMHPKVARKLFDALCEFYIPNKKVTEEQLKATQYHLEDMRKLVFK